MNTYKLTLGSGKDATELNFRLTLGGQQALKKKYKESALSTLFSAVDDGEVLAVVMTEALSYKGNTNPITDGVEVYDLLVDEGYAGAEGFTEIAMNIAAASGLISQEQAEQVIAKAKGAMDKALDEIFRDEPKNP